MNTEPEQQRSTTRNGDGGTAPDALVVDLGKQSKKKVQRLFAGEGALYTDVKTLMNELRSTGKLPANAVPVVVVVRQKSSRKKGRTPFPGL